MKKTESSLIFILSAALFISLLALLGNVSNDEDLFPQLYAPDHVGSFVTPTEKTIYLTFDDGPSQNTERILDVLKARGAHATFFVTAQYEDTDYVRSLLRRMVDEGHVIGLHSYTHQFNKIYASPDSYLNDLNQLREFIYESTDGYSPQIFRFPGGSSTSNAPDWVLTPLRKTLTERGYIYYDWDIAVGDDTANVASVQSIVDKVVAGVSDPEHINPIVLMHDNATPKTTPDAVAIIIDSYAPQGYAFEAITTQVKPVQLKPPY